MDEKEAREMLEEAVIFLFGRYDTNILAQLHLAMDGNPEDLFLDVFTERLARFRPDLFTQAEPKPETRARK